MIGVYKITNLINKKVYIGLSVNIEERFAEHKRRVFEKNRKEYNYPLYRAIRKYGIENFSFEILEQCDRLILKEREIFYISHYKANDKRYGYNQTDGGDAATHVKFSDDIVDAIIQKLKTTLHNSKAIADEFGVSQRLVIGINSGQFRHKDSETYPIRENLNKIKSRLMKQVDLESKNKKKEIKSTKPKRQHNKKVPNFCSICGKEIKGDYSKYCPKCKCVGQRKVQRPEPMKLAELIVQYGFEEVGRMFGVSGKAISKWCKSFGMPTRKKDLVIWYNTRIGIDKNDKSQRRKMSEIVRAVKQVDITSGEVINVFESQSAAARFLGSNDGSHIGQVCNGIRKIALGYKWAWA